jgi:tRNA G18 (ribose-2'-O)-methylase SpoU
MILIDDPSDPRVADYLNVRERDLVGRRGLFIAEGEVVLRHLLDSPEVEPVSVLLAQSRAPRLAAEVFARTPQTPVFVASQEVLDKIAGFALHRGILAVGRRCVERTPAALLADAPCDATVLVLIGISNHDNIGGLFRNAAAFGVAAVLLDETCGDPLYRKAIRVSVGAALRTPFARAGSAAELLDGLIAHGFGVIAFSPTGEVILPDVAVSGRTAVLFGAEGPGLSSDVLRRSRRVRIPMAAGFDSLNVATASGVALHHLFARNR